MPRKPLSQTTLAPGMSLIEASSTFTGTAPAGDCRTDHPSVHHPIDFDVSDEVFLSENLWRHIFALDRLTDDLVLARLLRLRLARRIQGVAVCLVPVQLNVEVLAADELRIG